MKLLGWPSNLPPWEKWVDMVAEEFVRALNAAAVKRFEVRPVAKAAAEALKRKGMS